MISNESVEAIKNDLCAGWTIEITAAHVPARNAFEAVAESIAHEAVRIVRVNGRERITTVHGGELRLITGASDDLKVVLK